MSKDERGEGKRHTSDCATHNAPALPVGPCDCIFGEPTPWVIERKGDYATVFDSAGKVVPLLTELDLGWTDTETGNYIDPQGDYDILERIVKAVNSYASNQATIRELVEALAERVLVPEPRNSVVEESVVREIVPRLKQAGAQGIVEYPLNKIIE